MSIKKAVTATINGVIEARQEEIAKLRKIKRLVASGEHKYLAKLYEVGENHQRLEGVKTTLKAAIWNVVTWFSRSSFFQWPVKSRNNIEQGACGIRIHVFVVDENGHNEVRIYDETLWWKHVESCIKSLMRTQPTRRRRSS